MSLLRSWRAIANGYYKHAAPNGAHSVRFLSNRLYKHAAPNGADSVRFLANRLSIANDLLSSSTLAP